MIPIIIMEIHPIYGIKMYYYFIKGIFFIYWFWKNKECKVFIDFTLIQFINKMLFSGWKLLRGRISFSSKNNIILFIKNYLIDLMEKNNANHKNNVKFIFVWIRMNIFVYVIDLKYHCLYYLCTYIDYVEYSLYF